MRDFSLSRVAQYARYHYATESRSYIWNWLSMFGIPLLFAILSRDAYVAAGMAMFIYLIGSVTYPSRILEPMRNRSKLSLELTLPISNKERWVFMLINLTVGFPLAILISSTLAMVCAVPFSYGFSDIGSLLISHYESCIFNWAVYVLIQIFASASLLISILARRKLIWAYFGALLGVLLFLRLVVGVADFVDFGAEFNVNINTISTVSSIIYCLIPVVFYLLSYVALCKRQVRW